MTPTSQRPAFSRRAGALAIALALVVSACGGDDSDDSSEVSTDDTSGDESTEDVADDESTEDVADETSDHTADDDMSDDGSDDAPVEGEIEEDIVEVDDTPQPGGTLRYGIEADSGGLNPTTSALTAAGQLMTNAVFDTLAAFDTEGNAVPYLAESIEPVDGDLSRWRIVVRDGVTFHDGTPLDAEAVRVNIENQIASPLVGLALGPFLPTDGAVTVVDDRTVEVTLLEPDAVFPVLLTSQLGMVASPTWLAAASADATLNQSPVGTGPFVFDSRSEDSLTRFVRNDGWWNGEVYLDAVEFLPVPDPDSRNDLLFGDEIDALHTTNPASVGDLQDDENIQNVIDETGEEQLVMLNTAGPPFDDIRARQALTFATPLQNFRDLIGLGVARGADQMFIPESRYYNPDVVQEGDDPEAAATLAADYCADVPEQCTDGKIDMEYQFVAGSVVMSRMADILTQGWSEVFNVSPIESVQDEFTRQVVLGQYQATLWRSFGGSEPVVNRHTLMCRTIGPLSLNFPRFCSEARDELILEAQAQTDPAARVGPWQQIAQDMNDAYTYVFLTHTIWDNAFAPSVRGICDRTSPEGVPLQCAINGRTWHSSVWLSE